MGNEVYSFNLPDIGEGVVEGEVIEWLKQVGEKVKQDEPVVVVMTDKATVELPSPYPGTLLKHYYRVGEVAIKDQPLYDLQLDEGINASKASLEKPPKAQILPLEASKKAPTQIHAQKKEERGQKSKALAVPKIRHLAREMGIDLQDISGTGSDGRITMADLQGVRSEKELASSIAYLDGDEEKPLIGIRGLMAKKMAQSHAHIPQFSYFEQVIATRLIQLRQNFKGKAEQEGIHLSFMPFFIRALALTAHQYPIVNSSLDTKTGTLILHKQCNVGIAIASTQGLIVPVLKGVQEMGLEDIIKNYDVLKNKALAGKVPPNEMKEATITISNFGVLGGEGIWATPMISEPEVAILALARIHKAPIVKDQDIVVKDVLPISWSFDHRIIDGEMAAAISHYYCVLLRDPAFLL